MAVGEIEMQYGYGYQFWRLRGEGFGCFGMGGQFALCMPEQDLILINTADNQAISGGSEHIVKIFMKFVDEVNRNNKNNILPENENAQKKLQEKILSLSIPVPQGNKTTENAGLYSGKKYVMENNGMGLKWISMDIAPDKCVVNYENNSGEYSLSFGMGKYFRQEFPEKYFGMKMGVRDTHYDSIAAGAWSDDSTFLGVLYSIDDYLGTIKMQLAFSENNICVFMTKAAEFFFDNYQGTATGFIE